MSPWSCQASRRFQTRLKYEEVSCHFPIVRTKEWRQAFDEGHEAQGVIVPQVIDDSYELASAIVLIVILNCFWCLTILYEVGNCG